MSDLEERVARAIYELPLFTSGADADWCDYYGRTSWEHLRSGEKAQQGVHTGEPDRDDYIKAARTIISVIEQR